MTQELNGPQTDRLYRTPAKDNSNAMVTVAEAEIAGERIKSCSPMCPECGKAAGWIQFEQQGIRFVCESAHNWNPVAATLAGMHGL